MVRVWIIELAEPLPFEEGRRLMRCGLLAEHLAASGHDVTWWSSSFSHIGKSFRCSSEQSVAVAPNYRVELLHGPGYRRNVSLARMRSQARRAKRFGALAPTRPRPDVIFAAMPTLEVSEAAVAWGRRQKVPVVVDIRDKWPDAFVPLMPRSVRPLARLALAPEFRRIRRICTGATALFAVSEDYLGWGLAYAARPRRATDGVFVLGYDSDRVTPGLTDAAFIERLGIQPHHTVVCFIGAFGATYDLDTVLRAARRVWDAGNQGVRFVLAGDGPRAAAWRRAAVDLPNVILPGWLSAMQISALLGRAQMGLAAYAAEAPQSLPNKPFEYFAGGLPVLSSLPGELARLLDVEGVGHFYEPGDDEALADLIERRHHDEPGTRAMGTRARHLAETRFAAAAITRRLAARLADIAGVSPPSETGAEPVTG